MGVGWGGGMGREEKDSWASTEGGMLWKGLGQNAKVEWTMEVAQAKYIEKSGDL